MEGQSLKSASLAHEVERAIENLRSQYPEFENAYDTYTQEYGSQIVSVKEPTRLSGTVDPVILILGHNCAIEYHDSLKELRGEAGKVTVNVGDVCILGRRQPQDSMLVGWSARGEVELASYNPRVGTIPSRVHGALAVLGVEETYFCDLCSSSGTVLIGDTNKTGQFVKIYDPGTVETPAVKLDRAFMSRKP